MPSSGTHFINMRFAEVWRENASNLFHLFIAGIQLIGNATRYANSLFVTRYISAALALI